MREWNDSSNSRPTYFNNFETIKTIMTHKIFHVSQPVTFVTFTWFGLPASLLLCRWTPGRSLLRSCKTWPLEIWELLVKLRKHFESSELEDHSSMFANIPRTCAKVEKLVVTKSTQEDPMLRFQFICKALVTCEATLEPSLENRRFEVSNSLNGLNPLQHSIYCLTWMWKVLSFSCFSCDVGGCFLWKKTLPKKNSSVVPLHTKFGTPIGFLLNKDTLFWFDKLSGSPTVCTNCRSPTCHAFDEDHAERLFVRGEPDSFKIPTQKHGEKLWKTWKF